MLTEILSCDPWLYIGIWGPVTCVALSWCTCGAILFPLVSFVVIYVPVPHPAGRALILRQREVEWVLPGTQTRT